MDKVTINSIAVRKFLERLIRKWMKKKGLDLSVIFTRPLEVSYSDDNKMIDADIQIHVKVPLSDLDGLLNDE